MRETSGNLDSPADLAERLASTRLALSVSAERLTRSRERFQETLQALHRGQSQRQIVRERAYARLRARLETMPVIEQARGILIAEFRCSAHEACDLLRAASRRSNTSIGDLAEQIVSRVASGQPPAGRPRSEDGRPAR